MIYILFLLHLLRSLNEQTPPLFLPSITAACTSPRCTAAGCLTPAVFVQPRHHPPETPSFFVSVEPPLVCCVPSVGCCLQLLVSPETWVLGELWLILGKICEVWINFWILLGHPLRIGFKVVSFLLFKLIGCFLKHLSLFLEHYWCFLATLR